MTKCDLRIKREFIQEVRATAQFYAKQHSTSVVSIISGNDLQTTFKGVNAQGNFKAANALKGVLKKVYKVDGELIKYSEGNIGINLGISDEAIKPIVEIVNSGTILTSSTDAVQTTLFSLNTKLDGAANIKLDTLLKKYLEPYNFTYADIEDIKIKYQVNSLGAIDLLQKVIFLAENRRLDTMPEEFSHALVMLMGDGNPLIVDLMKSIHTWSEYSNIHKQYDSIYKGSLNKIQMEAVGQLLSKAIVQKFKSDNKIEQSWFDKLKELIKNFFKSARQNQQDNLVKNIADRIAADVLNGKQLVDSPNLNSKRLLNYSKAVEQVPLAKEIIHEYTVNKPFNLTGSLGLASNQSNIFRDPSEPIHDLDFQVPYLYTQKHPDINDFFKLMDKPNIIKAHNGFGKPGEITYSFFILKKGYTFDKSKTLQNINNKILQPHLDLTVLNPQGEEMSVMELVQSRVLMGVDFFWLLRDVGSTNLNGVVSTRSTYQGKLQLNSYSEDPNVFFTRIKDQQDYISSTIPNPEPSLQRDLYFQLSNNEKELDFDELSKTRDTIHKYFENLNQEVSVSSLLDALKVVDQKDIQNFINNCK